MELHAIFEAFPDQLEVHRDGEGGPPHLKFVVYRRNARSFTTELRSCLEVLREAGHNVVVRVGSKDLTLEEFDQGVGYGSSHRHIAQSTYYNKQAELRRLERSLDAMSPDSPERYEIGKRVAQIKTLLGLSDQSNVSADALKKSDNALKSLEHALTSNVDLSDEQLERTPVQTAANWAQTNNRLWLRWKLNRSRRNLREFNAELTLQPDNLDLRSKINQEQETFEILVQQLAELTKTEATK